ncbi:MAG: hypothetical protein GXP53_08865 [Deltaproteobacteria bacterium]|nr:hypothetical protein [Deltaproteobacteria bacterium]
MEPVNVEPEKKVSALAEITPPPPVAPVVPARQAPGFADKSFFKKTAQIMGARFLTKGEYFFPRSAASDFKLDLSVMPVMVFNSGQRILLAEKGWLSTDERHVITSYWKKARILIVRPDLSLDDILNNVITAVAKNGYETRRSFTDGNISVNVRANYIFTPPGSQSQTTCLSLLNRPGMKIDDAFRRYLEGQGIKVIDWIENPSFSGPAPAAANTEEYPDFDTVAAADTPAFVHAVCTAMGWNYQNKVEVSFPYAGFQLKAVMDMISFAPGNDLLVDFGDLGGDAVVAIRDTGFNIVQLAPGTGAGTFIDTLSGPGGVTVSKDPVFGTADRPKLYNPSFQVTGELISKNNSGNKKLLIVSEQVPDELALFLNHRGVRLLVTPR